MAIGKRVRVAFQDLADHFALPQFTLTDEAPVGPRLAAGRVAPAALAAPTAPPMTRELGLRLGWPSGRPTPAPVCRCAPPALRGRLQQQTVEVLGRQHGRDQHVVGALGVEPLGRRQGVGGHDRRARPAPAPRTWRSRRRLSVPFRNQSEMLETTTGACSIPAWRSVSGLRDVAVVALDAVGLQPLQRLRVEVDGHDPRLHRRLTRARGGGGRPGLRARRRGRRCRASAGVRSCAAGAAGAGAPASAGSPVASSARASAGGERVVAAGSRRSTPTAVSEQRVEHQRGERLAHVAERQPERDDHQRELADLRQVDGDHAGRPRVEPQQREDRADRHEPADHDERAPPPRASSSRRRDGAGILRPSATKNSVTKKSRTPDSRVMTSVPYGKAAMTMPAMSAPISRDSPSAAGRAGHAGSTRRSR